MGKVGREGEMGKRGRDNRSLEDEMNWKEKVRKINFEKCIPKYWIIQREVSDGGERGKREERKW